VDWDACESCFGCTEVCLYGALSVVGREIAVNELGEQLLRDTTFYRRSGGGVTLSGGEPLLQTDFCAEILRFLKQENIHTALDTAGNVAWSHFEKVLPWVDLVLFDIKIIDPNRHIAMTRGNNQLIIENFKRLCREKVTVWVRTPLIAGINDENDETDGRVRLLEKANNVKKVELLSYHSYGVAKYDTLGMSGSHEFHPPSPEKLQAIIDRMEARGIKNLTR
jgi:pyruvate formate lyase activating enzyme